MGRVPLFICEGGGIGRRARLRCVWETLGVQIPSFAPNKVDNFDTIGIETIDLILFVKMLVAQGFSARRLSELVSLCVFRGVTLPLWVPIYCLTNIHAETIPRRKVSL